MHLFVYADESGTLDPIHNEYYTFGGLILIGKEQRIEASNRYLKAERALRAAHPELSHIKELKAKSLGNKARSSLFRSLNKFQKFGVVIEQKRLYSYIWEPKKTRQRFLDFAFKIGLKRALQDMMNNGVINASEIEYLHVIMDEHTTATDGRYELRESLEIEFRFGMTNFEHMTHFPPIFPNMKSVEVDMRDSSTTPLVRSADIVANRMLGCAYSGGYDRINGKVYYSILP